MATVETIALSELSSTSRITSTSVQKRILSAFGRTGPGILLVNQLPADYHHRRRLLLDAGNALPFISKDQLQALEFPDVGYAVGWSHGREKFNGVPDLSKGSFYANPIYDDPSLGNSHLTEMYPFDMNRNHWPTAPTTRHLQSSFKAIGDLISQTAIHLAAHCDAVVQSLHPDHPPANSLHTLISTSRSAKGRLLHYFPSNPTSTCTNTQNLWCGFHNDHSALTGLLPAQYYHPNGGPALQQPPSDKRAGLHIATDSETETTSASEAPSEASALQRIAIPTDCLAFQIGETAQILTGGILRATPHAVFPPSPQQVQSSSMLSTSAAGVRDAGGVTRVTFAMFLQPNPWQVLQMPPHAPRHALRTSHRVPPLCERFHDGDTFGQFAAATFAAVT